MDRTTTQRLRSILGASGLTLGLHGLPIVLLMLSEMSGPGVYTAVENPDRLASFQSTPVYWEPGQGGTGDEAGDASADDADPPAADENPQPAVPQASSETQAEGPEGPELAAVDAGQAPRVKASRARHKRPAKSQGPTRTPAAPKKGPKQHAKPPEERVNIGLLEGTVFNPATECHELAGVTKIDDTHYAVRRQLVRCYAIHWEQWKDAGIAKWLVDEDEERIGVRVRVYRGDDGRVLKDLGMHNGDVIHKIDRVPVTSWANVSRSYKHLYTRRSVELTLSRGDEELVVEYSFVNEAQEARLRKKLEEQAALSDNQPEEGARERPRRRER